MTFRYDRLVSNSSDFLYETSRYYPLDRESPRANCSHRNTGCSFRHTRCSAESIDLSGICVSIFILHSGSLVRYSWLLWRSAPMTNHGLRLYRNYVSV